MDARFYNSEDIDVQRLAGDLVNVYLAQGYQAQQIGNNNQTMVQLKKGGDFEAIIGLQAAISVTIQRTTGGVLALIGQQRWIDKAAVGAVGIVAFPVLWPLALTAGAGALRQASLGNQVLNVVDGLVLQQRPGALPGPVPPYLLPQVQQQWGLPSPQPQPQVPYYIPSGQATPPPAYPVAPQAAPAPASLRCPNCNAPYDAGDTFCSGCGRSLAPAQPQAGSYQHTVNAAPVPPTLTYQPPTPPTYQPPTPVYQPPTPPAYQPPAPAYQPPTPPAYQPPASVYQPPTPPAYQPPTPQQPASPPPAQVYYVPSQQNPAPASQPATPPVAKPQPKKPEEPYYVPPVTQEPSVKPQPKVTMVPGKPHQTPPPPKAQPHPQKQYYVPSHQAAQDAVNQARQGAAAQPTIADQSRVDSASQPTLADQPPRPIVAQPSAQPAVDSSAPWGTLTFENGQLQTLAGERVVIGRYDHDLGGIHPDIDLATLPNADTVSRVHATLEHIGSTYQLTDLNSTNATRINGKRLEPDNPQIVNDGDTLTFGKITCTLKLS